MTAAGLRRLAWLVLLPLCGMGPSGTAPAPGGAGSDTLTTAYEVSGVRVVQRVSPATDIAAARLYLLGGTRQLTERTAGIEALLLRASQYGTAQFSGAMARTGSLVVLDADADWTVFGFTGLAEQFAATWRILAERVMHPGLSEAAVTQARGKLLTEARRRYTEPDARIHVIGMQALFRDHSYALDPNGSPQSLVGITVGDLQAYARDQMVTSRMLLVVVGNVPRARVESLVTATIGQLPHGDYHWALPPAPPQRQAGWLIENRQLPTTYLLAYFTGPPPTSQRYWAFRVATAVLSSRLYQAIRVERGLSYAAYAPYHDWAIPVGGAYVSTPKPDSALTVVVDQINRLIQEETDYARLRRFIDGFSFDYLADNSSAERQADFLARAELYLGGYRRGEDFMRQLHSVQPHDLYVAARDYFNRVQFAFLGDTSRMHGHW
ncbi:MAG TPA: pitrilysin family protein [Gemmatimonadales bacterium]|jgi:zinc protease|nr:pitrilysin family protein [Gemmatimonadales bacterium]